LALVFISLFCSVASSAPQQQKQSLHDVYFYGQPHQWTAFIGTMFARMDTDGDTKVTRAEFESTLKPPSLHLTRVPFDFSHFDLDGTPIHSFNPMLILV
jgi:hypothetical protein